jgi:drug/metabolite transporter (DMT)-like permease
MSHTPQTPGSNPRLGISLMLITCFIFAVQDGISRFLGANYSVLMVLMVRFWAFAAFGLFMAARAPGGIRTTLQSHHPRIQLLRGVLLPFEIALIVMGFISLGLIETHAIFATYPLIVTALSGPLLGEKVGWWRWGSIGVGFVGMMIILQPGMGVFAPEALWGLAAALGFAVYNLLNRYVGRKDSGATSFLYVGLVGAIVLTPFGLWTWTPMVGIDWLWLAAICVTSTLSHGLLIRCYTVSEASVVQPFAFSQLLFVSVIGVTVFQEALRLNVLFGGTLIVAAGLFTLMRERIRARAERSALPVTD